MPPPSQHGPPTYSSSSAQIAVSNETADRFLGGSGGRSWMAAGIPPTKTRPSTTALGQSHQSPALPSPSLTSEASPPALSRNASPYDVTGETSGETAETATGAPDSSSNKRPAATAIPVAKRPRVGGNDSPATSLQEDPPWPMWHARLSTLWQQYQSSGQPPSGHAGYLFDWLAKACAEGDVFYVAFHQLLFCWNFARENVMQTIPDAIPDALDWALTYLDPSRGRLSRQIPPALQTLFTNFPDTLTSAATVPLYRSVLQGLSSFLIRLAQNWDRLMARAVEKEIPLTAYDLINTLVCYSPCLRSRLFHIYLAILSQKRFGGSTFLQDELQKLFGRDDAQECEIMNGRVPPTRRDDYNVRYQAVLKKISRTLATTSGMSPQPASPIPSNAVSSPHMPVHGHNFNAHPQQQHQPHPHPQYQQQYSVAPPLQSPQVSNMGRQLQYGPNNAQLVPPYQQFLNASGEQHPPQFRPQQFVLVSNGQQTPHQTQQAYHHPHAFPSQQIPAPMGVPHNQAPQTARGPAPVRVLQPGEYPHEMHGWSSLKQAPHLISIRSPQRRAFEATDTRYYQFVESLVTEPMLFPPGLGLETLSFSLTAEDISKIAKAPKGEAEALPISFYAEGARRYRLRLGQCKPGRKVLSEHEWAIIPSYWPPAIYIKFNDACCMIPRRQGFHKDRPVELTEKVREGLNTFKISFPAIPQDQHTYFIAVEAIITSKHDTLMTMVQESEHLTVEQARKEFVERLDTTSINTDSDDVVIASEKLVISLMDPFYSAMFTIPVRGKSCTHLQCFDLQTFLNTRRRPSKSLAINEDKSMEPTEVDCWLCPICGCDARPNHLRVDDYLAEVRETLVKKGKTNVRSIRISSDGDWTPVDEDTGGGKGNNEVNSGNSVPCEVIVLD